MNLHRLDLVSLSLFNLVVRTGSISRGAELVHLAVGAASKRISDLEDAVGAELFERHSRGVTLTHAGQALHRHAQRILADVDNLAADLSDHACGIVGVVRLVANTSAVTQFLPADLAGFIAAHAGIRIELDKSDSREAVLAVVDGRAEIGIFAERTPSFGLQTVLYRRDRLVLVVPAGHALASRAPQDRPGSQAPQASANNIGDGRASAASRMRTRNRRPMAALSAARRCASAAVTDLVGGQVQVSVQSLPSSIGFIKSGKLKVLGVVNEKRVSALPDTPTIGETITGFGSTPWYGLFAPAGTPKASVAQLQAALAKVLDAPDTKDKLAAVGGEPFQSTSEQFAALIKDDLPRWAKIVKDSGATVD